jgi:hypothetical protein
LERLLTATESFDRFPNSIKDSRLRRRWCQGQKGKGRKLKIEVPKVQSHHGDMNSLIKRPPPSLSLDPALLETVNTPSLGKGIGNKALAEASSGVLVMWRICHKKWAWAKAVQRRST